MIFASTATNASANALKTAKVGAVSRSRFQLGQSRWVWVLALLMSVAAHGLVLSLEDRFEPRRPVILKTTYQISLLPHEAGESVADEPMVETAAANSQPAPDGLPVTEPSPPAASDFSQNESLSTQSRVKDRIAQISEQRPSPDSRLKAESVLEDTLAEVPDLAKTEPPSMVSAPKPVEPKTHAEDFPSPHPQNSVEHALAKVAPPEPARPAQDAPAEKATPAASYTVGSAMNPKPGYPNLARRRGWQGSVVLGVWVADDGRAEDITIVDSSGYSVLDHAAWETVRNDWVFGLDASDAPLHARVYVEVPIAFQLQ